MVQAGYELYVKAVGQGGPELYQLICVLEKINDEQRVWRELTLSISDEVLDRSENRMTT